MGSVGVGRMRERSQAEYDQWPEDILLKTGEERNEMRNCGRADWEQGNNWTVNK